MQEKVQGEYQEIIQLNEGSSRKRCSEIIQCLHAPVLQASKAGKYAVPGGYRLYMRDMKNLRRKYKATKGRGVMKKVVLREFMDDQEPRQQEILAIDSKLNEEKRRLKGLGKALTLATRNNC